MNQFKVLILGRGVSGYGAAQAFERIGNALVDIYDDTDQTKHDDDDYDLVVLSPSVPCDHPLAARARNRGARVIGELELGFLLSASPIIAITGTNGKTTTTKMLGDIMAEAGLTAHVAGNIGVSASALAAAQPNFDVGIYEVSSFQLAQTERFKPHIAVITNISPDHLNVHKNMREYVSSKLKIAQNQTPSDFLVLSYDDIEVDFLGGFQPRSQIYYFSRNQRTRGAYASEGSIFFCDERVCDLPFSSQATVSNALAATAVAKLFGVGNDAIGRALAAFQPEPHRMELVATIGNTRLFNDSKGTNIGATLCALNDCVGDTCLIAGGSDKGYEYDELFLRLPKTTVRVIAVGATAPKLVAAAARARFGAITAADTLEQAVELALASQPSNVVFSPSSASFDRYHNYAERGEHFCAIVRGLVCKE